jgi:hypothetical protein
MFQHYNRTAVLLHLTLKKSDGDDPNFGKLSTTKWDVSIFREC